jgi:hypothetical protein
MLSVTRDQALEAHVGKRVNPGASLRRSCLKRPVAQHGPVAETEPFQRVLEADRLMAGRDPPRAATAHSFLIALAPAV